MDMACAEGRLRCAWISLILIYLDQNGGIACTEVRLSSS